MEQVSVINTILVPAGMEQEAENIRADYVAYFQQQEGFVSSTFYKSLERETEGSLQYVNIVVWESYAHFERVVNKGFANTQGENNDGRRVLGKGFPEPIVVSPGRYKIIAQTADGSNV